YFSDSGFPEDLWMKGVNFS
ncbi:unnamed protein product, partial [Allacma fusca]